LLRSIEFLGDVQSFCPDWNAYRYVVASTNSIIFGLAVGMHSIAFRLNPEKKEIALATGGEPLDAVGPDWVRFELFRPDWPAPDLKFWALRSYAYTRGNE
jgi:hypothetical protein